MPPLPSEVGCSYSLSDKELESGSAEPGTSYAACQFVPLLSVHFGLVSGDKHDSKLPQPQRGKGWRGTCREMHVFCGSGGPLLWHHCHREDKAGCLAHEEEENS